MNCFEIGQILLLITLFINFVVLIRIPLLNHYDHHNDNHHNHLNEHNDNHHNHYNHHNDDNHVVKPHNDNYHNMNSHQPSGNGVKPKKKLLLAPFLKQI